MNTRFALPLVLAALASQSCVYISQKTREEKELGVDQDGDGAMFAGKDADCDDLDPERSPNFDDVPYDGIDNDCQDDGDELDVDGDGIAGILKADWPGDAKDWPSNLPEDLFDCQDVDVLDEDGKVVLAAAQIFPGNSAAELPYDGIDSDCAGDNDFDVDKDGFLLDTIPGSGADLKPAFEAYVDQWNYTSRLAEWFPETGAARYGDCDDGDALAFPSDEPDEPYDGIDSNCDSVNDFDPDGDGYMPPTLPNGDPTPPAFNAFRAKYGLTFELPEDVIADPPSVADPLTLGAFDDCLDLGDPRPGAGQFDAASIYPRPYGSGDTVRDGVDSDCNRDNDFDADRDGYVADGFEDEYNNYIGFWGYTLELPRWGAVNPEFPLGKPGQYDCLDDDPTTYPAALEIVGEAVPVDQDCDGETSAGRFWFDGPTEGVVNAKLEWRRPGVPRLSRLGDVYMVAAMVSGYSKDDGVESKNPGVALTFQVKDARSQALPAASPAIWKLAADPQVATPEIDLISVDRCKGPDDEDVAYIAVQYNVLNTGADISYIGWYALEESNAGNAVTVADVGLPLGPDITVAQTQLLLYPTDVVMGLDGDCDPFLAGISDTHMYVAHGRDPIPALKNFIDPGVIGETLYASYLPQLPGEAPLFGFVVCDLGICSQHDFDIAPNGVPRIVSDVPVVESWRDTTSVFSKDEELLVVALPNSGPGLSLLIDGNTRDIFPTDNVVTAHGQLYNGDVYVAAIIDNGISGPEMVLAFGDPTGPLKTADLRWDPLDMPVAAAAAVPNEIGLFVDGDRVAVAVSFWDPQAPQPDIHHDAIGWLFLGVE